MNSLTDIYGKIHYIKKRIKKANLELKNNYINDAVLRRKFKHYNNMLKAIEREYVLLPNAYQEILKIKSIISKEFKLLDKELTEFFNKEVVIDWKTGEISLEDKKE